MSKSVIDEQSGPATRASRTLSTDTVALFTVQRVAQLLDCSPRHIRRLADRGAMPRPVRLGNLVRWRREEIEQWIAASCPNCRQGGSR